jgi:hypothetical protein
MWRHIAVFDEHRRFEQRAEMSGEGLGAAARTRDARETFGEIE